MKRFFSTLIVTLFFGISIAQAQSSVDLSLTTIPLDPKPLQKVTITAESFSVDLNQATITWSQGGRTIDSGTGRKSITITAPAAGQTSTITMNATGSSFGTTTASIAIRPGSIDLLWEASDSYTPPFYKGKALLSNGGAIRVTAIPSATAPKQLSYTWSRDNTILGSLSGFNKSSLSFKNSDLNDVEDISVTGGSGLFEGSASLSIKPSNPTVVVYQKNEGFIDYANGSNTVLNTSKTGLILKLEPFFFSVPTTVLKSLALDITEGGTSIVSATNPTELYLSAPEEKGQSLLTIAISTISYSLQNISRRLTINFL